MTPVTNETAFVGLQALTALCCLSLCNLHDRCRAASPVAAKAVVAFCCLHLVCLQRHLLSRVNKETPVLL
jgi:hypothetical protein